MRTIHEKIASMLILFNIGIAFGLFFELGGLTGGMVLDVQIGSSMIGVISLVGIIAITFVAWTKKKDAYRLYCLNRGIKKLNKKLRR